MSVISVSDKIIKEIEDLNAQAWDLNRENPAQSIELANKALQKSVESNYKRGIALAKKTLGACYIWTSKNEEGVEFCLQANDIFKELKDKKNGAVVYVNLGTNFYFLSDYDTALKCYNTSYNLNSKISYEPGMADALNGIGTVYYTIEQNEKALEALLESEKLCKKNDIKSSLVKVQDGIGETYYNLKKYDKALLYYNSSLRISRELKNSHMAEAYALDGVARTYTALLDYEKAIEFYEQSLKIRKQIGFKFGEATIYNHLGNLYLQKGEIENAKKYLLLAYELSVQIGSKEGVYQSSEKLAELFEKQNNAAESLKYYKIYHTAKEEVRNLKNEQMSKSFELQNKVLQTSAEKTILEERAKELENFTASLTLMSEIGQQIISSLSVETIVNIAYKSINGLMDATGFGIGIYYKKSNEVIYPLYIEGEDKIENIRYNINEVNRLTVICFNESKEIIINDMDAEISAYTKNNAAPKAGKHVESLIYLPLIFNENKLGVITVQSFNKNTYTNYHVNILKNLATYTAIALENAKQYEIQEFKVAERTKELVKSNEEVEKTYLINKKINEIGRHITSNLNLKAIFKELYESINEIMSVECFGVRIYKPETQTVEYKFEMEKGVLDDVVHTIPLTDDDNYTVWTIKNRKDIFLNDNKKEYSKYVKQIKVVTGEMPNSLMFTPMIIGEKLIGVITVQSFKYHAYEPHHLDILKTLATYTATALENAWLYENMEANVAERTLEVVKQKEEIEKTFENARLISEIGQEISGTFSIREIISKVYQSINKLMDATMFGIGIFDEKAGRINFPGAMEEGELLEDYYYDLSDSSRPAILCFTEQKEIVIRNFTEEFVKSNKITKRNSNQGHYTESIIYLPLTQNNKKIGVITVQSLKVDAYTDYHLQLIKSLAIYTTIALDNASLYSQMEDRVAERTKEIEKNYNDTRLLGEISKEISSTLSIEKIIASLYNNINKLMKAEAFGIAIYNKKSDLLEFKGFIENGKKLDDFSLSANDKERLGSICFSQKIEVVINDFVNEYKKYFTNYKPPITGNINHSIIYLPLVTNDEVIGVLTVQSQEKNAYSDYQVDLLKNLTLSIGIALDNAALYQNMEDKVNERTMEVVKQKEEIEKTFENARLVSEIGQEISSTFSIQEIISKVYNSINKLMDATMLGIGIYDNDTKRIQFSGAIEDGKILDDWDYELSNIARPAVSCYVNQSDIVIDCFTDEYILTNKIQNRHSLPGNHTESIIYMPLTQNNKKIGVITVQSFKVKAYNDYHLQLLKSLAIYTAIALDNASLYSKMEDRVEERTLEISKAYENTKLLSEVAEDISSSLSINTIISKVHLNVSKFMKADCFGIGLLNKTGDALEFSGFVEEGNLMDDFQFSLADKNRLAVKCLTQELDILINDYELEFSKYIQGIQAPVSGRNSEGIIYLPIYSKGKPIGVITVQSYEKNVYSDYQFNILKNLAVSVGIALDNASLYQNLEEKVNERTHEVIKQKDQLEKTFEDQRTMTKIGNEITSTLSVEEIIDKVYAQITGMMDAVCFGVGLLNKETNKLIYPLFIEGDDKFSAMVYDLTERDKLTYLCFNNNREIIINNFNEEVENFVPRVQSKMAGGIDTQSLIYLPMVLKEKVIGIITVQSLKANAYTDYHVQILKNLAVYVGIAIDNAFLYQNMEDMVTERTKEVVTQKELLEKNFNDVKLSAEIAKAIASSLSVETIVSRVYENVKSIVKTESFGIGLYHPEANTIGFSGFIEKGEKLPYVEVSMDDKERYAVMCFEKEIEIIINDHEKEYIKYTKNFKKSIVGETPLSLVYLPLFTKDKKIGVLTAQAFTKNAFQDFHVNIIKNMALSIAIALDNANLYQNLEQKVEERTAEVHKQKAIIEEKNKDITDSIKYAKKIQVAVAPNMEDFNRNFTDSFILFKPKDIVSGDFYWFDHFDTTTVFAAADCTGHGVPGAFMSLICSDIMYKVINDQKIHSPGLALNAIDERLVSLVKKSSESSANDGMDIALCAYHKSENKFLYAGAHRPLILIRDKQIIEYRPSKFSIGGHSTEGKNFDLNTIDVLPGDIFYLLTDGYADQFGGGEGKKFKYKNFKSLVLSICDLPMKEQKQILDENFESWRGTLEQIDDVCVIGVKI